MNILKFICILCFITFEIKAQLKTEYKGQISAISSYAPQNKLDYFIGGRYIPEINLEYEINPLKKIDFNFSTNIYHNILFHPFNESSQFSKIDFYRAWLRYTSAKFEVRAGLQKIDFGSATILRPLQWFNQVDPRDPLRLTNGVYGILGKYISQYNTNVWLWMLYGNKKRRGFDALKSNPNFPELGIRTQKLIPKGEMALSYHFRMANSQDLNLIAEINEIPESRIGIDGKWDVGVGIWCEASYTHTHKKISTLTEQAFYNVGIDYTFGIGNGLNILFENLFITYDEKAFAFENVYNTSALSILYPFTFFDDINLILYYNWKKEDFLTFVINYKHQFKHFVSYIMPFYNPSIQPLVVVGDFVNHFEGLGLRLILVNNH